jgi:amino acid transporter
MIQGLVVLNYEEYHAKRWHGTLIYWALLVTSTFINIWGARLISLIENASLIVHLAAFIAELVVILVCAPTKHSANFVFTLFQNESGWSSNGVAWSIGMLSSCYVLAGEYSSLSALRNPATDGRRPY